MSPIDLGHVVTLERELVDVLIRLRSLDAEIYRLRAVERALLGEIVAARGGTVPPTAPGAKDSTG